MNNLFKHVLVAITLNLPLASAIAQANLNATVEPSVSGPETIHLLAGAHLSAWNTPSSHWELTDKNILVGQALEKLDTPEWLYTKQQFEDFEFTCELKLTGDHRRNTGIYYRANRFRFEGYRTFEAPSGYEFDASFHRPGKNNYWGAVGDWYARGSELRVFADQNLIVDAYKPEDWNRVTLRARGNRFEYWINGIKIMDFVDQDPLGSKKGVFGLQIHDGTQMKVEYRNIRVKPLLDKPPL